MLVCRNTVSGSICDSEIAVGERFLVNMVEAYKVSELSSHMCQCDHFNFLMILKEMVTFLSLPNLSLQ